MDINAFDVAMGALVLPPIIEGVNRTGWPSQLRGIMAWLVCGVYALFVAWVRGPINFADWRTTVLSTAAAAFVAYNMFWKPSGIAATIRAITTPGASVAATIERPTPSNG